MENTSPTCGKKMDSVSLEHQKQAQSSESEHDISEQAILQEFLNTLSKRVITKTRNGTRNGTWNGIKNGMEHGTEYGMERNMEWNEIRNGAEYGMEHGTDME